MDALLNWLWQGAVVALALHGLLHLLDRARANVRYAVCWVALLLVIALPVLSWVTSAAPPSAVLAGAAAAPLVSVPDGWWTSMLVMMLAWTGWAGAGVVRFTSAVFALRRARARCRPFPVGVAEALPYWCRLRDEGRRTTLVLSDAITSAAVLGGGAPMIAVAPSLVATLEADELDRVVVHEWAHVQRRDDLVSVLQVVLHILAGWHPAAWLIERRLQVEREMACDEMTVGITGSPTSYAACLVKLATLRGRERTMLPVPAALRASGLRARVTRIVSRRASIAPAWSFGIATGVACVLCAVSLAAGGQRLVGAAVMALPVAAVPSVAVAVGSGRERIGPVVVPRPAAPAALSPARRQVPRAPQSSAAVTGPMPQAPASMIPETVLLVAPAIVERAEPPAVPQGSSDVVSPSVSAPDPQPSASSAGLMNSGLSPWVTTADKAADTGVTIGRTSMDAGVATAGFFSRLARRVAGSF